MEKGGAGFDMEQTLLHESFLDELVQNEARMWPGDSEGIGNPVLRYVVGRHEIQVVWIVVMQILKRPKPVG
jgi:hypothetical protein